MDRKLPIRTYQRKNAKKPTSISLASSQKKMYFTKHNFSDNNRTCNSLDLDPFETTFDRIAKGAVVPPLPLESTNENNSWNSNSSNDSDISDTKFSEHIGENLRTKNINISSLKLKRKLGRQLEISISKERRKISLNNEMIGMRERNNLVERKEEYESKRNKEMYDSHSDLKMDKSVVKTTKVDLVSCHKMKSCFVQLDVNAVQNWYNHERISTLPHTDRWWIRKGNKENVRNDCFVDRLKIEKESMVLYSSTPIKSEKKNVIDNVISCNLENLSVASEYCEQQTQVLLSSSSSSSSQESKLKSLDDIHTALTQNYNAKDDSLDVSNISNDEISRSLFSDTVVSQKSVANSLVEEYLGKSELMERKLDVPCSKQSIPLKAEYNGIIKEAYKNKNDTLFDKLQDPIRITNRRMRYSDKWYDTTLLSRNNNAAANCNVQSSINSSSSSSSNRLNKQYNNSCLERSIFLKPGKYWTRSLSILNNIDDGMNLDKLSIGKGKKWRHSVRHVLDMQKQGMFENCLKRDETFDDKVVNSYARLSKRISVRVVANNGNMENVSFIEAFGIKDWRKMMTDDYDDTNRNLTSAKDIVLERCLQKHYISFSEYLTNSYLEHVKKIGEGVYGEVFLYEYKDEKSVIKIIPIEGEKLVNGEPQKKFSEILSEIVIAKELHNLSLNTTTHYNRTNGFVQVKNIKCIIGKYPERLVEVWNIYDDDKTSDNDCPSMFDKNQLYIALELGHGGEDMEAFIFESAKEACSLFLQTALTLAVAEKAFEFEHRDMHWGNILVSRTKEPYIYYKLDGREIKLGSNGVKASIIDFTLSRMLYKECCIYNDLALDPSLFTAHGEYQFEIYRLMREKIENNWRKFEPYTNVLWLHYTLDKMITAVRYKRKKLKIHKHCITKLEELKDVILKYDSASDFVSNCINVAYLQTELLL